MNIKAKIIVIISTVAVLVAALIYFGFQKFYFTKTPEMSKVLPEISKEKIKPLASPSKKVKPLAPKIILEFKVYKNTEFGFEIQYPSSWTVIEEINENVRGEMVKEFFFKKPGSDLRFAILPRDGLSYGSETVGTSTNVYIGGSLGVQTKYILKDGRHLWLLFPQTGFLNWLQDIGRIDAMTSAADPTQDTQIFEKMLNSFKLKI